MLQPKMINHQYRFNNIQEMHTTKNIEQFKINQLKLGISEAGSWHNSYDSAYIFVGNLNYGMNEGDIAIVFSEFGQIVDLRLIRDKKTGKSKGFAFLSYEDKRSTTLAVDNFNGSEICGRILRVDHVNKYKPPKQFFQIKQTGEAMEFKPTGPDGRGWGKYREQTEEEKIANEKYEKSKKEQRQLLKERIGE